jgi:hypothetical protein
MQKYRKKIKQEYLNYKRNRESMGCVALSYGEWLEKRKQF